MTPNIDEHDLNVKLKNVIKFLKEGSKVKVSVRFRGREITHQNIGQELLLKLAKSAEDQAIVERMPRLEGRHMVMILSPKQPSA
jgi:translation initiation factor IF-3